ncbi:MAG: LPS export ABC transporter periplasmic protein LptC [Methylococcaceae bacterium]
MNLVNSQFYLILISLAIISWWLVKLTGLNEENPIASSSHSPAYFAQDYNKWTLDQKGQLKEKLFASHLIHYNDDGTTHLSKPELLNFPISSTQLTYSTKSSVATNKKQSSTPWFIKAEQGILSADGKELQLNEQVLINRINTENSNALTINTRNLHVALDTQKADTKEWVELLSPPQKTTGIGMELVFAQPIKIRLLAKVQGHYEVH